MSKLYVTILDGRLGGEEHVISFGGMKKKCNAGQRRLLAGNPGVVY